MAMRSGSMVALHITQNIMTKFGEARGAGEARQGRVRVTCR